MPSFGWMMLPPLNIFRLEPNGEVLWVQPAADLKAARLAIEELMASSPYDYVIHSSYTKNNLIVRRAFKRATQPVVFQIAYIEELMASRAETLKAHGFTVISTLGNEAAKVALAAPRHYSLFIVGHGAPPNDRREIAAWLKAKYPQVEILALNPPSQKELASADYNVVANGPEEWIFVVEASTSY